MGAVYTQIPGQTVVANATLDAIAAQLGAGAKIVDQNGAPQQVIEFMGGLLVGPYALPLNVLLDGQWRPQQKEILQPYWDAGTMPRPPADVIALPIVDPSTGSGFGILGIGVGVFVLSRVLKKFRTS